MQPIWGDLTVLSACLPVETFEMTTHYPLYSKFLVISNNERKMFTSPYIFLDDVKKLLFCAVLLINKIGRKFKKLLFLIRNDDGL